MRFHCFHCGKSVSTEVPDDTVLRAICICPECIESGRDQIDQESAAWTLRAQESREPGEKF